MGEPVFQTWLEQCRQNFGKSPRTFDDATKEYLQIEDGWIFSLLIFSPMARLLKNSRQRSIFQMGQVVWGQIVQANNVLFEAPDDEGDDRPAVLVFSLDPRSTPEKLAEVAERLYDLKSAAALDPARQKIADHLNAGNQPAFGWQVPSVLTDGLPCHISTTLFMRKHLPGSYLQSTFLPVVVSHQQPYYAMPLPARFWPQDLIEFWQEDGEATN